MPPTPRSTPGFFDPVSTGDAGGRAFDVRRALLEWYARHKRDLPWRRQPDPYRVVVAEIMLQQTQVHRVAPYFEAFLQRFPTFEALAAAARADVVRLWGGLGYNRRAVHLHELARAVVGRHGGRLPADRLELLALPGIGPYTAGAILSIAFGLPEPALDTNARRVILRYAFGARSLADRPAPRRVVEMARRLVPPGRAGDWSQALMELGATICRSQRPRCLLCPIQQGCLSAGRVEPRRARTKTIDDSPYVGSARYYRGKLLAQLRAVPPDTMAPLEEVEARLAASRVAEPPAGWAAVSENLARDGLARVERTPQGIAIGLG